MTGVPLFLFAFLVSSWEMDGKAERRWLVTSPCDNKLTIALRTNALRAYEGKSSEMIPPGPRSRVGTVSFWCHLYQGFLVFLLGRGYFVCPFLCFYQDAPSPFRPVGHFGGVLWRLETILWHIHGFSTDT